MGGQSPLADAWADSLALNSELAGEPQIVIPDHTDLDFYLQQAMLRNPSLKASYYRWVAELEKAGYEGALPDPVFNYAKFIESVETRVGPQEQRFGIMQSIPWFGTLGARKDISLAAADAAYQRFESQRLRLFYQVKSAYYDYYLVSRELQITNENFELLKFWESVTRTRYKVGLQRHPDVIKAQVELGKLEDRLQSLEELHKPAAAQLRALLHLPEVVQLPMPDTISVAEAELNDDSLIAAIRSNNPDLLALGQNIEMEAARARLAGKQSYPNFTVGVDYIQTGPALNPDMAESGKDPWMVGVGVSLPIWFGKNKARRAEAEARQRSAEYALEEQRDQLTAYSVRVLFEHDDAARKTALYRDGLVPKAEQSLNASYGAYQAGGADFLSVLDAQRQLLDFQLTVERERVRLAKRAAELEMLSGHELAEFQK
ncbi:MAG: TolC family protein [bacterium]